ncbi:MAG TPA: ABC transporter substrate-binding protein [Nitrolancea sp.]|nr:ABC transporter substrate-binding protein [Nitrolancea sp.]
MSDGNDPRFLRLYHDVITGRLSRRQVLRRGAALGLSGGVIALLLEACGGGSSSTPTSSSGGAVSTSAPTTSTSSSASPTGSPAASGTTASGGTPKPGGSIIIGTLGEASSINPFVANESEGLWRSQMLYDQLVGIDPSSLKPAPAIAKSWDVNNLTFTFHLQDNAKFSDGSDVTADDVVFAFKGTLDKKTASPYQSYLFSIQGAQDYANGTAQDVSGIKTMDPKTVQVTLATPDTSFLFNLRYIRPVPSKQLQGKDLSLASKEPFWQHPVGAGPFKFVSWTTGADFVAERNDNYYGAPKPYLDKFTHRAIADSDSLANALLSGGIDGTIYANPATYQQLKSSGDLSVVVPPFSEVDGWYFNCKNPYLGKVEVRQAVAYAMDMTQFSKDSLFGLGKPGVGPITPGNYAYDKSLQPWPYDMDKAKSLLQQAGTPPAGIVFAANSGNVLRQDFVTYTQQQLSKIGWKITPKLMEWATLVNDTQSKNFDVVCGPGSTYVALDPGELYQQYATNGSENDMSYSNPDLDKLLTQVRQELDISKQVPIYTQIQKMLVNDFPSTYAWYRPYIHVFKSKFAGYTVQNVLNEGVFNDLQNWYQKS